MSSEIVDDRAPGKWVSSCQRCLNYLYLDENEYKKFIGKYNKSLNTLFTSLGADPLFEVSNISMIDFFEKLSNLTGIDFPLCSSCLDFVKQENIKDLNKDKTVGFVLERLIGAMTVQQKMDSVKTEQVAETSQEEEQVINKTVNELQDEKAALQEKIQSLRVSLATVEKQKLDLEEIESELMKLQDTMNSVTSEISLELSDHSLDFNKEKELVEDHKRQLELLMHYSVLNDAFTIWFEESAITINGVKATRVGNQIDWASVNAILGDLAQVVDAMYHLYGKTYSSIVLKPMGSFSEIIDYANKTSYCLHANQKTWKTKLFSSALHLFLVAVQELAKHCLDKFKVELRYPIENDCVGGYDFLMNDFDTWTSALRLLAIDIKQLIVYSYTATLRIKKH